MVWDLIQARSSPVEVKSSFGEALDVPTSPTSSEITSTARDSNGLLDQLSGADALCEPLLVR